MKFRETATIIFAILFLSCSGGVMVREDHGSYEKQSSPSSSVGKQREVESLKKIWQKRFLAGVSGPIVVSKGTAILPFLNGEVVAVRLKDGSQVGRRRMGKGPVVDLTLRGDWIYFALPRENKQLVSYDIAGGKFNWRRKLSKGSSSMGADSRLLFVVAGRELIALNQTDGSTLWNKSEENPIGSSLLSQGKQLFYTDRRGNLICRESEAGGLNWKRSLSSGVPYENPSMTGETLIVTTLAGAVVALNVFDGAIIWEKSVGHSVYASPVIEDGLAFVASSSGEVKAFRLVDGEAIWTFETGELLTQPVMIESTDYMVVTTQMGDIYLIDIQDGEQIFHEALDARIMVAPAVSDDIVLIADDQKQVTAYKIIPSESGGTN